MSRRAYLPSVSATLLILITLSGCSGSDIPSGISGSSEEVTIKGKVLVNGKPVKGGELSFRVANVNRPTAPTRLATVNADGTYEVTTLVGQNYVEITKCKELQTPKMRRFLDDDTGLYVTSGATESIDINYPPIPN